jgi:hypothetical protein
MMYPLYFNFLSVLEDTEAQLEHGQVIRRDI